MTTLAEGLVQPRAGSLEVLASGPLATVQDLGRPGQAHLGVGTSGACDRAALRRANRLAGNPEGAAGVELTFGGLAVRAHGRLVVALTGAAGPVDVDGSPTAMDTAFPLWDGAILRVGVPHSGARTYLAVHGGIAVAPVLGSRSTDLLAGLGPRPLKPSDVLPVGTRSYDWTPVDVAPGPAASGADVRVRIILGPHDDWFTPGAVRRLVTSTWTVTNDSNRVGLRLAGPQLDRSVDDELPSELSSELPRELPSAGLLPGAIQVPPSGRPTMLLVDHPVTGGYPVIAVVRDRDLDLAGQLRPGQRIHLRAAAPTS